MVNDMIISFEHIKDNCATIGDLQRLVSQVEDHNKMLLVEDLLSGVSRGDFL